MQPSNDLEALSQLVHLPAKPSAVLWQRAIQGSVGFGPTDWSLTAVLDYSPEEARALVAEAKKTGPTDPLAPEWLPDELRVDLKKAVPLDAQAFRRPPLSGGNVYYLEESSKLVLMLFTV